MTTPSRTNWIELSSGVETETFHFSSRDWKVLLVLRESLVDAWFSNFGSWKTTHDPDKTIALPGNQFIYGAERTRKQLLEATRLLIARLEPEKDLLACDYKVRLVPGRDGKPLQEVTGHGIASFTVGGKYFGLSRRPGMCQLEESVLWRPRMIDLRRLNSFETDDPTRIEIKPVRMDLAWLEILPAMELFLQRSSTKNVTIRNHMK